VGVWLTCGSRHESDAESGVAHFTEHMLFKGTTTRSAQQIAQTIDSIGGQLDAFTAKEHASYYIKVLDDHLPIAIDLLSDMVLRPAFAPDDVQKEQTVILEEIKMVEDAPDDLVYEMFSQRFWADHPLGRPILGTPDSVSSFSSAQLRQYFSRTYVAPHLIIAAAGNVDHARLRDLIESGFASLPIEAGLRVTAPPAVTSGLIERHKEIEQSHICVGTPAYPQAHVDRHAVYVLNTILGGSMSSRLFQHIREQRGLVYAVFSNLTTYSDAGTITVYAGCAHEKVPEVIDLTLAELRGLRDSLVPADELRRAKDHLKGSLMLSLENTASRMAHLARQELYFGRHVSMDETLREIEAVEAEDVQRIAVDLFRDEGLVATVVGPRAATPYPAERLRIQRS
jgi:predicted Zn-dependent peptidase